MRPADDTTNQPLLPIEIIRFDPVSRRIIRPNLSGLLGMHVQPTYFDISRVSQPADRIAFEHRQLD